MPRRDPVSTGLRLTRRKRRRRLRLSWLWPSARLRRRWMRALRRAPAATQLIVGLAAVLTLALAINWIYQVVRKPSELLFPVSGTLYKTPSETWRVYAPIFRKHSTDAITPEFLAALAQVEGSGNPVARTYWRGSWKPRRFGRSSTWPPSSTCAAPGPARSTCDAACVCLTGNVVAITTRVCISLGWMRCKLCLPDWRPRSRAGGHGARGEGRDTAVCIG